MNYRNNNAPREKERTVIQSATNFTSICIFLKVSLMLRIIPGFFRGTQKVFAKI